MEEDVTVKFIESLRLPAQLTCALKCRNTDSGWIFARLFVSPIGVGFDLAGDESKTERGRTCTFLIGRLVVYQFPTIIFGR
jgi:hypothetical protein